MKHFFHPASVNKSEGQLEYLTNSWPESKTTDFTKALKLIYDMIDVIYDKRLDATEQELIDTAKRFFNNEKWKSFSRFGGNIPFNLTLNNQENGGTQENAWTGKTEELKKTNKVCFLEYLWRCMEIWELSESFKDEKSSEEKPNEELILLHLVRGNIAVRLSQICYSVHDLVQSELWGQEANEILWHGGILSEQYRSNNKEDKNCLVLDLLMHLNIAAYYCVYAMRNRRSNFASAEEQLSIIKKDIDEIIAKEINVTITDWNQDAFHDGILNWISNALSKTEDKQGENEDYDRQLSILYMEVFLLKSSIYRQYYKSRKEPGSIDENIIKFIERIPATCYTALRYKILFIIEHARHMRDKHIKEDYLESMKCAVFADVLSNRLNKMEQTEKEKKEDTLSHNMDATLVFSSSLRKYLKFRKSDEKDKDALSMIFSSFNKQLIIGAPEIWDKYSNTKKIKETTVKEIPSIVVSSTSGENASKDKTFFDFMKDWAKQHHLESKIELIKWYCFGQQLQRQRMVNILGANLDEEIFDDKLVAGFMEKELPKKLPDNPPNLHLLLYKGMFFLRRKQFSQSVEIFEYMLKNYPNQTNYIRLGTIGLKARFLLATAYMSIGCILDAKLLLEDIHGSMKKSLNDAKSVGSDRPDMGPDMRVLNALIYCHIRQGNFRTGLDLFADEYTFIRNFLYYEGDDEKNNEKKNLSFNLDNEFMKCEKITRRRKSFNNLIFCALFANWSEIKKANRSKYRNRCYFLVKEAFNVLNEIKDPNGPDCETELLKGYFLLLGGTIDEGRIIGIPNTNASQKEVEIGRRLNAHPFFQRASNYSIGFSKIDRQLTGHQEQNIAATYNRVSYLSAYLINLVFLYDNNNEKKYYYEISRFILNLPKDYPVSLKAAMALAHWLIEQSTKKKNLSEREGQEDTNDKTKQLFRSFSYIEIFKENGSEVFRQLRMERSFRLFPSDKRGKLLAYLLNFYKPIIDMKEECAFNSEDYQMDGNGNALKLVHYTKLETLKKLLSTDYHNSGAPLKKETTENEPRFRLSNCGYMNDVKEGRTMLECMETVIVANRTKLKKKNESQNEEPLKKAFWTLVSKYFPDLKQSGENRQPNGSNIYIGCLSVKPDSFSMGTVYSANETGCTVQFEKGFFDIRGVAYKPEAIRDYLPPFFTDQDYPLYNINYIGRGFYEEIISEKKREKKNKELDSEKWFYTQDCHTRSIKYARLFQIFEDIHNRWEQTDKILQEELRLSYKHNADEAISPEQTVKRFIADRLNEVRFLFKNSDYEFEGEVRVVYIDSDEKQRSKTDSGPDIPLVYVDVERDIKNLIVTLGSRIDDADVSRIVAWLNHTGRVNEVKLAQRNRLSSENTLHVKKEFIQNET